MEQENLSYLGDFIYSMLKYGGNCIFENVLKLKLFKPSNVQIINYILNLVLQLQCFFLF